MFMASSRYFNGDGGDGGTVPMAPAAAQPPMGHGPPWPMPAGLIPDDGANDHRRLRPAVRARCPPVLAPRPTARPPPTPWMILITDLMVRSSSSNPPCVVADVSL